MFVKNVTQQTEALLENQASVENAQVRNLD